MDNLSPVLDAPDVPTKDYVDADVIISGTQPSDARNELWVNTAEASPPVDSTTGCPTGMIAPWAGVTAPTGWLLCDGSAVSRTGYAALFGVCSTAYGSGNGSTTFNVPDLRGRTVVAGGVGAFTGVRGTVVGAETVTLTEAQMPAHLHNRGVICTGSAANPGLYLGGAPNVFYTDSTAGHTGDRGGTNLTGGGGAHNNIQPSMVLQYIIKA